MFHPTKNEYKFQYLITGIADAGIEKVYLPEIPDKKDILFAEEKKWVRQEMSPQLKKWVKEWRVTLEKNPGYIHPHYDKIAEWESQEVSRSRPGGTGVFFYNGWEGDPTREPEIVYITPFHYWYLTSWKAYFGYPEYRDSDREIFYWIQFWEEDMNSFGGALNTIRRYGKSSIMGAWITYRATMNYSHNAGMQGEKDEKIKKFYKKMVLKPFYKLPYYYQPKYNTDTKQTNQIEFDLPPLRSKQRSSIEMEEVQVLESMIDYRPSNEEEYDGDILGSYLIEEPGKNKKMSIYNDEGEGTWDIVKPCFLDGEKIIGKALLGTTVENMTATDKGGKAYKKLVYDSDYNQKQEDGRTISGLYFAFLPGDCAYKGYVDSHGRPKRAEAMAALMRTRKSYAKNSRKLAGWIRKYPLSIKEIFYVSPDRCEFNATVIQDRIMELDTWAGTPITRRIDLYWENNVRFSKVLWRHNPTGGFIETSWLPSKPDEMNLVGKKVLGNETFYFPKNDLNFASGIDPIQHGSTGSSTESRPVQFVKSKYKSSIDGQLTQEELIARAQPGKMVDGVWVLDPEGKKYQYKTNLFVVMMDHRPHDPNILYERALMICWLFGVSLNVEKQFGGGLMSYFYKYNCGDFILPKFVSEFEKPVKGESLGDDGTSASVSYIQEATGDYAAYIEYFGHMIPFRPQLEDALEFNARKTTEHDYTVAGYNTTMAEQIKPKTIPKPVLDLGTIMPRFGPSGEQLN